MSNLTNELAQFAASYSQDDVPQHLLEKIGRRFAILTALAAEGANTDGVSSMLSVIKELSDSCAVGLLGREERLSVVDAPIVTGSSIANSLTKMSGSFEGNWFDAAIVAAAISAGESRDIRGVDLLCSLVVASEVGMRVESAMTPDLTELGWAPGCVASIFGAATVAGRCFGLGANSFISTFGLAATQVSGFATSQLSDLGEFAVGKAAGDGTEAALLSKLGFSGPLAPIEGRRGLVELLTPGGRSTKRVTQDLGKVWQVEVLEDRLELSAKLKFQRTFAVGLQLASATNLADLHQASREDVRSM